MFTSFKGLQLTFKGQLNLFKGETYIRHIDKRSF